MFSQVEHRCESGNRGGVGVVTVPPAANDPATATAWLYSPWMLPWSEVIDPVADQNGFAGVVSVHRGGETEFAQAYGLADRACQIPNTVRTRFAIASGTKGLTALTAFSSGGMVATRENPGWCGLRRAGVAVALGLGGGEAACEG